MATHRVFVVAGLLSAFILSPGLTYSASVPVSVSQMVADAKKLVKTVSLDEFKAMYKKNEVGLLVDVRDPNEYATGHIPGAINVSRGRLEFDIWQHVGGAEAPDLNAKMVLYCGSGARCVLASKTLTELGFTNVIAADMRLADWKKAGYPFE